MSEKIRFQMRISPDTDSKIKKAMEVDNCQSQNEFVEKALRFYCGYVSANDSLEALPPLLASAIRGSVQDTENRIARLLFKMAVELDMVMNVVAGTMKVKEEVLKELRVTCIQNVKRTNGTVIFDDAVKYQRGK